MTHDYIPPVYQNINEPARIGDLVRIKKGFWGDNDDKVGQLAVVEYTYASQYYGDGENEHKLGIYTQRGCGSAWWSADRFELIARDQLSIKETWQKQRNAQKRRLKNFTYIAKSRIGKPLSDTHLPSDCLTFLWNYILPNKSMWGARGEGIDLYFNQMRLIAVWETVVASFKQPVTKRNWPKFRKQMVALLSDLKRELEG